MPEVIAVTAATIKNTNNEVAQTLIELGYEPRIHSPLKPPSREELRALLDGAVAVLAGSEPYTPEVLAEATALKVISRNGIGYDAIDLDAATERGIVVTFVPDAMVDAVADMTLGLILATARRITEYDRALKAGDWRRIMGADLANRTLGLIGTGRIGMAVARRARAFRMRLAGHDPYPNPLFVEELGGDYLPLGELLEISDFVSLHLPASKETRGMFGAAQLARMKPSAYLINCARGSLIDEAALVSALQESKIAGAGLDVFADEPPVPGSAGDALMRLPNVVATPHVAAATPVTAAKMGRAALQNILNVLKGERPAHVANPGVFG
jgi:D-3-phosphoglycerate dehydrogenase